MTKKGTKKGQAEIRLLLALIVIFLGAVGSIFWGIGIALENSPLSWIGRLLVASLPFIVVLLERLLK